MSFRPYITIDGREEKIYEAFEQRGEYLCDACKKIMDKGIPQAHLSVSGTLFHTTFQSQSLDPHNFKAFPLDLHMNNQCIQDSGVKILKSLPGWSNELSRLITGPYVPG